MFNEIPIFLVMKNVNREVYKAGRCERDSSENCMNCSRLYQWKEVGSMVCGVPLARKSRRKSGSAAEEKI
jgi:hypothetical protein